MIDQIILSLLHALGRRKVNAIFLTDILNLFPRAREPDNARMKFRKVGGEHGWRIACGVASDEDREESWGRGGTRGRIVDEIDHLSHFVEFFRADIRTVSKAEVDLFKVIH